MGLLTKPNELMMKETYAGLIYGQPGVGKSTLALSSINPVCIDIDQGMYRVEKRYQVPSLQVENYQQILDLLNSSELDGFDTIVIDTLGKLVDCMGEYIGKIYPKYRQINGQLTLQGWGQIKVEFHALIRLINGRNKSVLFVAHESEEKEGDVTKKRPDVSGSAGKGIAKDLDFMGYMEMSGNRRTISFSPCTAFYAKNSIGLDSVIEIPAIQTGNNFIRDVIVAAIKNRREQDKAQAGPYDELVKTIDGIISGVKDIEALNGAYEKLTALEAVWDSKLYAKSKISEAAKALNAKWDKPAGRFVAAPKAENTTSTEAASPPLAGTAPSAQTPSERTATSAATSSDNPTSNTDKNGLIARRKELGQELIAIMAEQNPDALDYFTDDERQSVKTLLSKAGPLPQGIAIVQGLIDKWREELQKREASYVSVPFEDAPADEGGNQEDPSENEAGDGFEDDIPWDKEGKNQPAKNSRKGTSSFSKALDAARDVEAAKTAELVGASEELDIFYGHQMCGFLITPSLYSAWKYWKDNDDAGKEDFLDTLNKVEKRKSPAMQAGIDFENAIRRVCDGGTSEDFCVLEAAEIVNGGIWQQRISQELDGDLVYGIADVIRRNTIFDIKRVNIYDLGKYEGSIQHLIYMYATGIPNFEYVISDGNEVYAESYHWGAGSLETLKERIAEMKSSLLSDEEMSSAFRKHWMLDKEDVKTMPGHISDIPEAKAELTENTSIVVEDIFNDIKHRSIESLRHDVFRLMED